MRVLFIGKVWPEPASSAAGTRMVQLLRYFTDRGDQVHFGSAAAYSPFAENLSEHGVLPFEVQLNHSSFEERVKALDPDVVVFDRFMTEEQFGWRVAACCPRAARILDTEDLHCLREAREQALRRGSPLTDPDLFNETATREVASIYRCDLSLIISPVEQDLLKGVFGVPAELLHFMPYLFEALTGSDTGSWQSFSERRHFISIGNFLHGPNLDAVLHLKKNIWPLIRHKLPDTEVHIYGSYGEKHAAGLHNPNEGFMMKGRAADSAGAMSAARVCLAPLRFGAGIKGKLVEAMRCGTPSVTTWVGAEGLGAREEWPGTVAGDVNEFAEAAAALYTNEAKWNSAVSSILPTYNHSFDRSKHESAFGQVLDHCLTHLQQRRSRNFTGAMLMQDFQHAKRWLGKYLELKNAPQQPPSQPLHEKEKNRTL